MTPKQLLKVKKFKLGLVESVVKQNSTKNYFNLHICALLILAMHSEFTTLLGQLYAWLPSGKPK